MNKDNLIKVILITIIFTFGTVVISNVAPAYQKNFQEYYYWYAMKALMYALIGIVLGIKTFQTKPHFQFKKSDIFLIVVLLVLALYPVYLNLLPYTIMSFLMTTDVNIIAALMLGYLLGHSVN